MITVPAKPDSYSSLELAVFAVLVIVILETLVTGHTLSLMIEALIIFKASIAAAWAGIAAGTRTTVRAYPGCERAVRRQHGNHRPKPATAMEPDGRPVLVDSTKLLPIRDGN